MEPIRLGLIFFATRPSVTLNESKQALASKTVSGFFWLVFEKKKIDFKFSNQYLFSPFGVGSYNFETKAKFPNAPQFYGSTIREAGCQISRLCDEFFCLLNSYKESKVAKN